MDAQSKQPADEGSDEVADNSSMEQLCKVCEAEPGWWTEDWGVMCASCTQERAQGRCSPSAGNDPSDFDEKGENDCKTLWDATVANVTCMLEGTTHLQSEGFPRVMVFHTLLAYDTQLAYDKVYFPQICKNPHSCGNPHSGLHVTFATVM